MLFENEVQQRLSRSRNKILINLIGDESLEGLVIDWHLAEHDVRKESTSKPISRQADYQPTYAYA